MFFLNLKSKIQKWLPWLVLLLIIAGQLNYLPDRLDFLCQLGVLAHANTYDRARLTYGAASYDLLVWVEQNTLPDTTLLLLTASPQTYGDPAYVLYHRALYHLYPRTVWWAAPVSPRRYPAWWIYTDLTQANILTLIQKYHTSAVLADGFAQPPVPGQTLTFDADTWLIFVESGSLREQGFQLPDLASTLSRFSLILRTLAAVVSIWLWGDILSGVTLNRGPSSWPRRLAQGWLLGCGLTSLGVFLLLWAGLSLKVSVVILSILGGLLWLYVHRESFYHLTLPPCFLISIGKSPSRLTCPHIRAFSFQTFFLTLLLLQVCLISYAAWAGPLADWDAWVNWASKARAIFIDQTLSPAMYHNPARLPTNQDYPLMLPLVEAWFFTWLGQLYEPAINFISLLFYLALLLLFYHVARLLVSPPAALGFTALLATIPRLERPASSGLADIPLAALVLLSFVLLLELIKSFSSRKQSPHLLAASPLLLSLALSTAFLPWLKNEGWLWWIGVSLSLLVGLALQTKRKQLSRNQAVVCFLVYVIPAIAVPLLWQLFLMEFGTYRFTFLPLTLTTFWTNLPRLPLIGWNMLTRLLNPYWNFVWLLAGLTLMGRRQRVFLAPLGWLILPITGYLLLVSLSYIFSRFDPFLAHLNNSAERLILQTTPLGVWWLLGQSVAVGWVKEKPEAPPVVL